MKDGKVKINLDRVTEGATVALYDKNGNEITKEYSPYIFGVEPIIDLNLKKTNTILLLSLEVGMVYLVKHIV